MGFGGGGSGAFSLPNHDHTNALLHGGALDEAVTLINDGGADVTLLSWWNGVYATKTPAGYEILDTYECAVAEASHTFTPGIPLSPDVYSKLTVVIQCEAVTTGSLQAVINGLAGTLNDSFGQYIDGTSINFTSAMNGAVWTINSNCTTNRCVYATLDIYFNDIGALDLSGVSQSTNSLSNQGFLMYHHIDAAASTITSVEIKMSTTWKIGSKVTIFGVRRV